MTGNFYATLAQVMPLLLLAFIWDSGFLGRLRRQRRLPRDTGAGGVWFWTKPRVRIYTLAVSAIVMISIATAMLVLGGLIPDTRTLRIVLSGGLVLILATMFTRITADVIWATSAAQQSPEPIGHLNSAQNVPPPVSETVNLGEEDA